MTTNQSPEDIERLLAEADELIQRINSDALKEIKEERRLQLEIQAQKLQKLRSEAQSKMEKKPEGTIGSAAEGMHEAFQEIAKAMRELKLFLS